MLSIPFLYLFLRAAFRVCHRPMDILCFGRKLPFAGAALVELNGVCRFATCNCNCILVAKLVATLPCNLQLQQAPLKGCAWLHCRQVAESATLARREFGARGVRALPLPCLLGSRLRDISCNGGIYPLFARPFAAQGRVARTPTGRARVCVRRRLRGCVQRQLGRVQIEPRAVVWRQSKGGCGVDEGEIL